MLTMDTAEAPINFRFLPAYRKHKRTSTSVALTETVCNSCDDHADVPLSHNGSGEELFPAEVEIVPGEDKLTSSPSSSSSSTLVSLSKPSVIKALSRSNQRQRKCMKVCKRVAAFLLSTVGLTMLTVTYAVAGGYLFQALESHADQTVKSSVKVSLQWHIDALWNGTQHLNVLHPVNVSAITSFVFSSVGQWRSAITVLTSHCVSIHRIRRRNHQC